MKTTTKTMTKTLAKTSTFALAALASLAPLTFFACGGDTQTSCPNDPPPPTQACAASDLCCPETRALLDCAARNTPAICGADGKTDAMKAAAACPNENAVLQACILSGGESCESFAQKAFAFTTQPATIAPDATGTAKVSNLDGGFGGNLTCQVLDGGGNVVPNRCSWGGLIFAETLTYGPLPAGTYKLSATASYRTCAMRTITSDVFQVGGGAPLGRWMGSGPGYQGTLTYTYEMKQDGTLDASRLAIKDANADIFAGCSVQRSYLGTWRVNGARLELTATSGTVERTGCASSSDNVSPAVALDTTELAQWNTDNSGSYAITEGSPRTLNITSTEAPPALKLQ